jgi:hypothetical protein
MLKGGTRLGALAHACNPSYSGGRDYEDPDLRLAWANSQTPIKSCVW